MKKQNSHDERVITQRRKVNSEAFGILMIVLIASIFVQEFLLNAPLEQYVVELICFMGMSLYMIIRYVSLGVNIYDDGKPAKSIPLVNSVNSMVVGIVVTVINGVLNHSQYSERYTTDGIGFFIAALVFTFISSSIFTFAVLSLMSYLNKKKQVQIQKRLDEDELE